MKLPYDPKLKTLALRELFYLKQRGEKTQTVTEMAKDTQKQKTAIIFHDRVLNT